MTVGFAATTQKADHLIKNIFKTKKSLNHEWVDHLRGEWNETYIPKQPPCNLQKLLNPRYNELEIIKNPSLDISYTVIHDNLTAVDYRGHNGMWCLEVVNYEGYHGFTISVEAGGTYRFHPDAIKHRIVSQYGKTVYESWKDIVKNDIGSLEVLVKEIRKRIKKTYTSATCCDRASRLCKRVGIPVAQNYGFLFPSTVEI